MFGIGGGELILILLFGFLIVGPEKLPSMMRTVGKGIAKFRSAQAEMNEVIRTDVIDTSNPDKPFKDPTNAIDKLGGVAEKHLKSAASEASSSIKKATHDEPASTEAATATAAAAAPAAEKPQETFTERKARYERERAARRAAEEKKAAEAAEAEAAAKAEAAAAEVEAAPESEPAASEGGDE